MVAVLSRKRWVNSLLPVWCICNLELIISKLMSLSRIIYCDIALRGMSQDLNDGQSTLVLVMAWCRQAASHYQNQCWPSSLMPYGMTKPQRINPCWAKFVLGNIKYYKFAFSIIYRQYDEIVRWNPLLLKTMNDLLTVAESIQWLLITWWRNEPGYQQPRDWHNYPRIFQFQPQKCQQTYGWVLTPPPFLNNGLSPVWMQTILWTIWNKIQIKAYFLPTICIWKCCLWYGSHFSQASVCLLHFQTYQP